MLTSPTRTLAVCGHGGLDSVVRAAPKWKKGAVFVLDEQLELLEVLRPPRGAR